jgi:MerR family transcriptional regulator, light-induced transcriptional regulator
VQCLAATGDYLRALSRQDRSAAIGVASRALETQTSVAEVIEQMLVPAQVEVGIRAQHDDWSIAEEHAATAITEVVLGTLALRQPAPVPRPAPICVTTPPGEWHGMAARMVAEGLRARRWDAIYLGSDLPDDHLGRFLSRMRPAALLLSCTTAAVLPQLARSLDVAIEVGVPTIVGGSACGADERRALAVGANAWARDTASAHALLSQWVDDGVAPPPARRAGIPADYLELTSLRSPLVDRLAEPSAAVSASASNARHQSIMRQVGAQLVDVLAASLFVNDPRLFDEHVRWLADMFDSRGIPSDTIWSILDVLQSVIHIPRAEQFTTVIRPPRSV